ncbi:hypothetical protein CP532_0690 [Ophiocordyceps camponoti-leonardi (nom. inval.)]|nr:hypothetical protein CP532_0690 [Ophiocordyceps camponoti-leonardi (nom. inval.)]
MLDQHVGESSCPDSFHGGHPDANYEILVGGRRFSLSFDGKHKLPVPDLDVSQHDPGTTTTWMALEGCLYF